MTSKRPAKKAPARKRKVSAAKTKPAPAAKRKRRAPLAKKHEPAVPWAIPTKDQTHLRPAPAELLQAIRAAPADDAPREAVARWYDEQQELRGLFIRQQLAGQPTADWHETHVYRWRMYLGGTFVFARGFVDNANILVGGHRAIEKLGELLAAEPVIRDLTISMRGLGVFEGMGSYFAPLLLQPLERLVLADAVTKETEAYWSDRDEGWMDHSYREVTTNNGPRLLRILEPLPAAAIAKVGLVSFGLGDDEIPAVVALPLLRAATEVDLRGNLFSEAGKRSLQTAFGARLQA